MEAGAAIEIGYFGLRAVESMRLEKGYLHWKADIITEYDPVEAGLDRFVKMDKDFIGRSSLLQTSSHPKRRRLITLELASSTVPAQPGDSVLCNGSVVGTVTSAGWGHRTNKNVAYAFVDGDARDGLSALVSATEFPPRSKINRSTTLLVQR